MSAQPKRLHPAGTGRGVDTEKQGTGAGYHSGYHRIAAKSPATPPRTAQAIALELHAAAGYLTALGARFATGDADTLALSRVDALLVGTGRLIVELRARECAGGAV